MAEEKGKGRAFERQLMRLLRAAETSRGALPILEETADRVTLDHAARNLVFPSSLLSFCLRDGLMTRRAGLLRLEPAGRSRLRRLQHPDMAFHAQHADLSRRRIELPDGKQTVLANESESPVARLFTRRARGGKSYLSRSQFAAAEKLRADFERGRLRPRMSVSWHGAAGGRGRPVAQELSDFALDARRQVERAVDCLDPALAGVAIDICCFLKGLEQVERERQWPPRSAKLMLRTALSVLAAHYGFEARAKGGPRAMLHWGDETYRPEI